MHGYFPDPVPYQSLIKFRELRTLTSDEFFEFPDAVYCFVTAVTVILQISLQFPNLLKLCNHMAVILSGFSQVYELLLQEFFFWAESFLLAWIVFRKQSFNVTLHLLLKAILLLPESVKGIEACRLKLILFYGSGMAGEFCLFRIKSCQTAPYHGFLASVVPLGSSEVLSALAAEDNLGESMMTAEAAFPSVRSYAGDPAQQFILNLEKEVFRDNGFMVTFHIILRHDAVVLDSGLVEKIRGIGFLEQGVTNVLFIPENFIDGAGVPDFWVLHGIIGRPRDDRYLIRWKKYSSSRYPKAILLATLILLFVPSSFPVLMGWVA